MFSAEIFEFGSMIHAVSQKCNNRLLIADNDLLWGVEGITSHQQLMEFKDSLECFRLTEDGVWMSYEPESFEKPPSTRSFFVDIFNNSVHHPDQPITLTRSTVFIGDVFYTAKSKAGSGEKKAGIYKRNLNGDVIEVLPGKYVLRVGMHGNHLIVRRRPGTILCLDLDLQEIWSYQTARDINVGNYDPQFINDTVICYLGESVEEKRDFQIVALSLVDGSVKWSRTLEDYPQCWIDIIGNKIYTTVKDRILILDAYSGEIYSEISSETLFRDGQEFVVSGVSPVQDGLLVVSVENQILKLFTPDGKKCLQTIRLPGKYFPDCRTPIEFDGKYYITLGQSGVLLYCNDAMLVLSPENIDSDDITVRLPTRPSFEITQIKNAKGEHEHIVSVSYANLEELIRYATITLKEIALVAASMFNVRKRDKKHNGLLHLRVDPKPLPKGGVVQLSKVKERVERSLDSLGCTAGNKEKDFQVLIEKLEEA
jgi:outer membrane protein assembly factor BamB